MSCQINYSHENHHSYLWFTRRCSAIGAGPTPILAKNLLVEKLTQAIAGAETNAFRKPAQAIGWKIRSEDGIGEAMK
jgi:hypothetical protein